MLDRLQERLLTMGPLAVAVSGGVDSMTLAVVAHRLLPDVAMIHARSPAVPDAATARVRDHAAREGWRLEVIDAGEFADPRYRANPVDRCYFCKTHLYDAIGATVHHSIGAAIDAGAGRSILSGANLDDLGEYRPGLDAAREHGVRHPYVEAGIGKAGVRRIAASLGLDDLAELPSSPCLSSRVETGIAIEPATLRMIHAVEEFMTRETSPRTVRCRVRAEGIVVELDEATLARIEGEQSLALMERIRALQPLRSDDGVVSRHASRAASIRFERYRTGSAFLVRRE